jgi:CII-binding regulator of phage lambda lysogenization HflD
LGMCVLRNPKSLHKHKINHHLPCKHLHQPKMRIKLKIMKKKIKTMSHLKRRIMIKGEMTMIKTRKMSKKFRVKDRHTQESTKRFKEITP